MPELFHEDPYFEPDDRPSDPKVELRPFQDAIRRLLFNWAKQNNPLVGKVDAWAKLAQKWPVEQVERAVDRCIDDPNQKFEPSGFAEFAKYLPALPDERPNKQMGWWSCDGSWGGDWSKSDRVECLAVAAIFSIDSKPRTVRISKGFVTIDDEKIEQFVEEERCAMTEGQKEAAAEFMKMVYRRRSLGIKEEHVVDAGLIYLHQGVTALWQFARDPEGFREGRRERDAMVEGIQGLRKIGAEGKGVFGRAA